MKYKLLSVLIPIILYTSNPVNAKDNIFRLYGKLNSISISKINFLGAGLGFEYLFKTNNDKIHSGISLDLIHGKFPNKYDLSSITTVDLEIDINYLAFKKNNSNLYLNIGAGKSITGISFIVAPGFIFNIASILNYKHFILATELKIRTLGKNSFLNIGINTGLQW